MTIDDRVNVLTNKISASTQERDMLLREIDCVNVDKVLGMPSKRARTILKQIRRQNATRFKQIKKLDGDLEKFNFRLAMLKAEREARGG